MKSEMKEIFFRFKEAFKNQTEKFDKKFSLGEDSQKAQKIQKFYRLFGFILICSLVGGYFFLTGEGDHPSKLFDASPKKKNDEGFFKLETVGNQTNQEKLWRFGQEKKQEKLSDEIKELKLELKRSAEEKDRNYQNQIASLKTKLEKLKSLQETTDKKIEAKNDKELSHVSLAGDDESYFPAGQDSIRGGGISNEDFDGSQSFNVVGQENAVSQTAGISSQASAKSSRFGQLKLELVAREYEESEPIKTVDNTIPAGAFAKAALLSGVDASASLQSAENPRPVLLRIVDAGKLPRRFQSDLEDCHCTASSYGDLSSERVYMRLEKLTCTERETGEIVETEVAGYITGSDGRSGVRGVVVEKDAKFLVHGMVSGLFSGLSAVASPENRKEDIGLGLLGGEGKRPQRSKGEMFQSGMLGGASNSLDRLSDYYIQRAEQIQPIIQVPAGQLVDIIFTQGTFIGDTVVKREISKVRDRAREKAARKASQKTFKLGRN